MKSRGILLALATVCFPTLGGAQNTPGGVAADQAYTFYSLDTRTTSADGEYKTSWQLRARFGVYGEIPERSVLKYVVKQGSNVLSRASCQSIGRSGAIAEENPGPDLYVTDCRTPREQMLEQRGQLTVEWTFINGSTDAETVVDTDTITIRDAPTVDVGNNNRPFYPRPYVDRNAEILSTVMYLRTMPGRNDRFDGFNRMYLVVNASPNWGRESDATRGSFLRCTKDGQPVELRVQRSTGNSGWTTTDEIDVNNSRQASSAEWIYPNPNGNNPRALTETFLFRQYVLELPLTFTGNQMFVMRARGTETNRAHEYDRNIGMTQGAWECQWRNEARDTLRVFRWTVGADGLPVAHQEQSRLSFGPGAYLIETVVPEGNVLDARTNPGSIVAGAFNGHGFTSDSGRQQARAVPAIGTPHPPDGSRGSSDSGGDTPSPRRRRR